MQTVSEWRQLCVQRHLCQCRTEIILSRLSEMGRRIFLMDDEDMEPFCEMTGEDFPQWYSSNDKASVIPICSRDVLTCTLKDILRGDVRSVSTIYVWMSKSACKLLTLHSTLLFCYGFCGSVLYFCSVHCLCFLTDELTSLTSSTLTLPMNFCKGSSWWKNGSDCWTYLNSYSRWRQASNNDIIPPQSVLTFVSV